MTSFFDQSSLSFINRFPFTKEAKDYVKFIEHTPEDLLEDKNLVERAKISINNLFRTDYLVSNILNLGSDDNWKQYALVNYFLYLISEPFLWARFAEFMRKALDEILSKESLEGDVLKIATKTFDWTIERIQNKIVYNQIFNWRIKWYDFISVSSSFMIDEWKLVNYPIESGWIYLNINKIKRVVAEKVRSMIVERGKDRTQQIPEKLQGYIDEIKDKIKTVKEKYQVSSSNITIKEKSEAYPPCINRIINKTKSGFNLGHIERLILVFFLLNIELSVEEILNLFRMQPDFDEERARYYIEHAAGKIGGHTKYKPYNCNKLQSFEGICARDDDPRGWCNSIEKNKQIKNPIVYYSKMVWYISSTIRCPKCESRIFKDKLMKQEIKQCNFCKTDLSDLITSENVSE